ncbi:MAG: hypothetical protein KIT82_07045 [Bradyrhizobium sp.]|nr:hypothetical protein [Bradyrhizobium sp.]
MVVRDLKQKIDYLIACVRDGHRLHAGGSGAARTKTLSRVKIGELLNDTALASAIGSNAQALSHAKAGRRHLQEYSITRLCELFGLDQASFVSSSFEAFRQEVEASAGDAKGLAAWHALVRDAPGEACSIVLDDPYPQTSAAGFARVRYADPGSDHARLHELTRVPLGAPFWFIAHSPPDRSGKAAWAGWRILLFNHELRSGGFSCLVPRFGTAFGFAEPTFPSGNFPLRFPRFSNLRHRNVRDLGQFEIVLVAAAGGVPAGIEKRFADEGAQDAVIAPTLTDLASWLHARIEGGSAAIAKAAYQVVPAGN